MLREVRPRGGEAGGGDFDGLSWGPLGFGKGTDVEVFGLPPVPGWGRWTFLTFPDSGHRTEVSLHTRLIVMPELGL